MRRKLSIKNKNAKLSENTKFQKTLAVDNKVYFNIQGNPETNVNHSNYSILNKVQLLQKQQFLNYFVKNYTRQQNFVFFFFTSSLKRYRKHYYIISIVQARAKSFISSVGNTDNCAGTQK